MATIDYPRPRFNPLPLIGLIVLAAILVGAGVRMLTSAHAVERHGADAQQIRQCYEQNGPVQEWQGRDNPDLHCFVVDTGRECSRFGIIIAQVWNSLTDEHNYRECTAFFPRGGNPSAVERYLSRDFVKVNP